MKMTPKNETPAEFTQRANSLLQAAQCASAKHDGGDHRALNRCLNYAKTQRMTWAEGLEYSIEALK
jgi:hypothetical protein